MPQRNARGEERTLERERASKHEPDEIIAPQLRDVGNLLRQLAIAPDAVARDVRPQIDVAAERRNVRRAWLCRANHGTRLGILLAEASEGGGDTVWHDDEIALYEPGSETRRRAGERARSRRESDVAPVHDARGLPRVSGSRNAARPRTRPT